MTQVAGWAGEQGRRWASLADRHDAALAPFGAAMLAAADLGPGERVLDVGCGAGATTLAAAERVSPGGVAVGLDISDASIRVASARCGRWLHVTSGGKSTARALRPRTSGVSAGFVVGDADAPPFPQGAFDVVTSRFGLMFFTRPQEAFGQVARALRRGGRLAAVVWGPFAQNPWMGVPRRAVETVVDLPDEPDDSPGPFSLADRTVTAALLRGAGLDSIGFSAVDEPMVIGGGGTMDQTMAFLRGGGLLRSAKELAGPARAEAVEAAVRGALEPFHNGTAATLGASATIVTARRAA